MDERCAAEATKSCGGKSVNIVFVELVCNFDNDDKGDVKQSSNQTNFDHEGSESCLWKDIGDWKSSIEKSQNTI